MHAAVPATAPGLQTFVGSCKPRPRTASTSSSEARPTAPWRTCPRRRASRNAVVPTPVIVSRNEDSLTPPYNAAVAAAFLNRPSNTAPGLGKDRRAFTTNAELAQWLKRLGWHAQPMRPASPDQSRYLPNAAHHPWIAADASEKSHPSGPGICRSSLRWYWWGSNTAMNQQAPEALPGSARELAPGGLMETLLDKINVIVVPQSQP